jgi:hypothetical protein
LFEDSKEVAGLAPSTLVEEVPLPFAENSVADAKHELAQRSAVFRVRRRAVSALVSWEKRPARPCAGA